MHAEEEDGKRNLVAEAILALPQRRPGNERPTTPQVQVGGRCKDAKKKCTRRPEGPTTMSIVYHDWNSASHIRSQALAKSAFP